MISVDQDHIPLFFSNWPTRFLAFYQLGHFGNATWRTITDMDLQNFHGSCSSKLSSIIANVCCDGGSYKFSSTVIAQNRALSVVDSDSLYIEGVSGRKLVASTADAGNCYNDTPTPELGTNEVLSSWSLWFVRGCRGWRLAKHHHHREWKPDTGNLIKPCRG